MSFMFSGCENLKDIDISGFNTSKVTNMENMFAGCKSLEELDLSNFDTSQVTNMFGMFRGCCNLTNLDLRNFNTSKVKNMAWMFLECENLVSLNVSNFNTSQVEDMDSMFDRCSSLTNLNVSNFDTSKVTSMDRMWAGCKALMNLNISDFNTSEVKNMRQMFSQCESLTSLDVSSFNTHKVTNTSRMFEFCKEISNLNLSGFDTSQVTDMQYMFCSCNSLVDLDISNFRTDRVTNMSNMFCGCSKLSNLNLHNFDMSQVKDLNGMFFACSSLSFLDLGDFNANEVTDMGDMFIGCSKLTSLDLSNFDASNVISMNGILEGCRNLTELRTPINVTVEATLPANSGDTWYLQNGTTTTIMPLNRKASIYLKKNEVPQIVYDKLRDWSGSITIPAGESKHLEYTVKRSGDYLYRAVAGIELSWQDPQREGLVKSELILDGDTCAGFTARVDGKTEPSPLRFTLENTGDADITITLVTDRDFTTTAVQEGGNAVLPGGTGSQAESHYYSFTPDTYGYYQFPETNVSTGWVYEQASGLAVAGSGDAQGGRVLEAGKTYLFRAEGQPGTVFSAIKKLSKDMAGNQVTIQRGVCYAFTPSETGYYGSVDPMEGGKLYNPDTEAWVSWKGNQIPEKLEAGETYLLYAEGTSDNIRIAPRKQVTVLDYCYYRDFKEAGGQVSVGADGKVTITRGSEKWTLKSCELPLYVAGGTTYQSLPAEAFSQANLYWGRDLGIFKAAEYYDLDGNSRAESEIRDGDVILVEYRPEIVWVRSMQLKCSKAAMEPGDTARMTAELSKGQDIYDFTKEPVIRWASSNPGIAEVDARTGEVTAHMAGSVTITAYADEALREQEGMEGVVKASLNLKIAAIKKTFTKISNWGSSLTVGAAQTKYFVFRTQKAGDYLIEIPQGVKIKTYSTENMSCQEVRIGEKTYACGTFPGEQEGSWQFEIWNTNVKEAVTVKPVTHWELAQAVELGASVPIPVQSEGIPSYFYYSFAPEVCGSYTVEGTPLWICGKDGSLMENPEMLLAAGEVCCMKFEGGEEAGSFAVEQNPEYQALPEMGEDQTYTLRSGQKYVCVPDKNGSCTAFTSRLDREEVQVQYFDGKDWTDWPVYEEASGNYSLPVNGGKAWGIRITTGDRSPVKIGLPGYKNPNGALTSTLKLTSLTDAQLAGQGSASRMSASYKGSGTSFTANGTLKYVRNCSEYLGADGTYQSGYFLALRLNVQKQKFREGGYISISYLDKAGNRQKQFYEYGDAESTLKEGYVDLILDLNGGLKEAKIRVAPDAFTNAKTYRLKLENLKREEDSSAGTVTEAAEKESGGVRTSAPVIMGSNTGETEVVYDAVAYSVKVQLPGREIRKGNNIALKVEVPESMKNTKAGYRFVGLPETALVYAGIPEGASYLLLVLNAGSSSEIFGKTFEITWGVLNGEGNPVEGSDTLSQTITVNKTKLCYFETIPADAVLPKSLSFNGLSTTMYAGQTQDIAAVLNRKYEEDLIRLSYSTSDNSILSVNRVTGVIQALKAGTATVTVEALDPEGNRIAKSAKITVKNPTAPGSVKVSNIKDTSVTLSWSKNVTGQKFEIYAVPYDEVYDAKTRKTAAKWKEYVEAELNNTSGTDSPEWRAACVPADSVDTKAEISGLEADTPYVFYIRNLADTAAGIQVYAGSLSGKSVTKKQIFSSIKLTAQIQRMDETGKNPAVTDLPDNLGGFTLEDGDSLGAEGIPNRMAYRLLDKEGNEIQDKTVFTSVTYKSSNTSVVKVDKNGNLTLGGQAGTARLYVTGKDTSGAVRTSEADALVIRVKKSPASLKGKTTTLVIGQSITLKELIAYNGVKGSLSEIDTEGIDFQAVLEQIPEEYFVWDPAEPVTGDTRITAAALVPNKKGVPASGGTVKAADFVFTKTEESGSVTTSTAAAAIKINDMPAPAIKSITPADTSVTLTFAYNSTVRELAGEHYYYTVTVKDMVTGGEAELRQRGPGGKTEVVRQTGIVNPGLALAMTQAPDMSVKSPLHTCVVSGLSGNKKYRIRVTAHYDVEKKDGGKLENQKASGTKDVTTRSRLLASENGIGITYISLSELKKQPELPGTPIFREEDQNTEEYGQITLENNETYVLMAQVSNLARALESDKIKWAISSGDKKAATIKAGASTFEAQLKAQRTGTFTVTAASSVTKEVLATFTVTIIPYQSSAGGGGGETRGTSGGPETAYLGGILGNPFEEERKKAA